MIGQACDNESGNGHDWLQLYKCHRGAREERHWHPCKVLTVMPLKLQDLEDSLGSTCPCPRKTAATTLQNFSQPASLLTWVATRSSGYVLCSSTSSRDDWGSALGKDRPRRPDVMQHLRDQEYGSCFPKIRWSGIVCHPQVYTYTEGSWDSCHTQCWNLRSN